MDADSNSAGGDRLSRLGDATLGHILSFLPAAEAARAAALSRRWRHVFPAVHTLNFPVRPPRLVTGVSAALFGRDRGPRVAAASPLRALRVAFDEFGYQGGCDARKAVDGWLSYAAYHAAGETLEIDLRLDAGEPSCKRTDVLLPPGGGEQEQKQDEFGPHVMMDTDADPGLDGGCGGDDDQTMYEYYSNVWSESPGRDQIMGDDDDYVEASSKAAAAAGGGGKPYPRPMAGEGYVIYVTPKSLFTCAALRSLRLSRCGLDLPSTIALPSLVKLHLTRVTDQSGAMQRLVAACPRLADLTLEACDGVTDLSVPGGARLRRLALQCCHELAAVAVGDSSELRVFEYHGAVLEPEFLTMHGPRKIKLCTIDLCAQELSSGTPELDNLMYFLQPFTCVERLHLTSARLGCGIGHGAFSSSALEFPAFPELRNLELTGMLPGDDISATTAVTRILERTPRLETLSLFFLPEPHPDPVATNPYMNYEDPYMNDEETIHAAHKLRYDRHATLAVPDVNIPCMRERMREINLVHYQGAMAQRMLAKFLLRNAPVVDEVWCEFARGPLSIQTKLMGEIEGWVLNKSAKMTIR
ncbi:unnamed protein product [Urochloa decumbens]|uniref:F-box domain-containing protein n=1 Tax=Urochloa decumbens TaxID=240449 RepID=A0ABC9AJH8_9POAL